MIIIDEKFKNFDPISRINAMILELANSNEFEIVTLDDYAPPPQLISTIIIDHKKKIPNEKNNNSNAIISTFLYAGNVDMNIVINTIANNVKIFPHKTHYTIMVVEPEFWTFYLDENGDLIDRDNLIKEKTSGYSYNDLVTITIRYMSIYEFFLILNNKEDGVFNINNQKYGYNPIIIFKGFDYGKIVYLFNLYNYNLNGGSITRRHVFSPLHERLGKFLTLSGLAHDYFNFIDIDKKKKLFLYPKIPKDCTLGSLKMQNPALHNLAISKDNYVNLMKAITWPKHYNNLLREIEINNETSLRSDTRYLNYKENTKKNLAISNKKCYDELHKYYKDLTNLRSNLNLNYVDTGSVYNIGEV